MSKTMEDLFHNTLKDMYFAERQIYRTLPKIARAADSQELKDALLAHREETSGQIERLVEIFEMLDKPARGRTCEAIKGILDEGDEVIEDFQESDALVDGIIASCQAVEHYEIARYGALRNWAKRLGMNEAAKLLEQTLAEEQKTDELLTRLANSQSRGSASTRSQSKSAARG